MYLKRLGVSTPVTVSQQTLIDWHERHVRTIPFENLDIHYGRYIVLDKTRVFQKIMQGGRGGFCYELNYLFCELLKEAGFDAWMISARVTTSEGMPGPPFDHLAIVVRMDNLWLLDVGFGDLFVKPVAITPGLIQHDGRNYFKIEQDTAPGDYALVMSADGQTFQKKYVFELTPRAITDFEDFCRDKQISADSYFVKNIVCTLPTEAGRVTLFNDRLIETQGSEKHEAPVTDEAHRRELLAARFGISI